MQEIETKRLILRNFRIDDVPAFFRLGSVPEVIRYVGNSPFKSLADAQATLLSAPLRDYEVHGYGRFACVWKETGEIIGFSGVKFIEELSQTELGYRFLPEYWGQGLASEAGQASIDYARCTLGLDRLIGLVHPENQASARVLQKLGFSMRSKVRLSGLGDQDFGLYAVDLRSGIAQSP
jgi:[ribosomal protein S5]-alanine N-acetyltransferase